MRYSFRVISAIACVRSCIKTDGEDCLSWAHGTNNSGHGMAAWTMLNGNLVRQIGHRTNRRLTFIGRSYNFGSNRVCSTN